MKTKRVSKLLTVLVMGLALASCGKDNKANSNSIVGTSGLNFSNPQVANNVNNLRSQHPCGYQGEIRTYSYTVNGQVPQHYVGKTWVGVQYSHAYPDIIVVQAMSTSQINYQLSMCPLNNGAPTQITAQPQTTINLNMQGATGRVFYQEASTGQWLQSSFTGEGYY